MTVDVTVTWLSGRHGPDAADRMLVSEVSRVSGAAEADVHLGRSCPHCGSATHGRPVVSPSAELPNPPADSLSRADGALLVAVSVGAPGGVDVERAEAGGFAGFASVALHPREIASTPAERSMLWARKEALLKATGHGLRLDPRRIRISDGDRDPRLLEWPGEPAPTAHLCDLGRDGYAACVAVLGDHAPRVTVRQGDPAALAG